ncbi:SAM-dependent methyltransferase, MidA family [Poseidonocella pacifica]|uniref:SAM-dependent methyltransferase, MidA family n=1 Tax=Poseidonocella pacifica TaxID=871651 RepID=A0A1I0XDC1_9RHOB|nr:SAM-dependent methyltransferase [Poseidonocella pacifica]SFA98991.1 SAM-dependent methyltransferase, MidA family [Poseidonocella pacifica]
MTPLAQKEIRRRIAEQGPITLADYMAECLMHPQYGYYSTRDPFGTAGDFVTAPEISQVFGELIGLSIAQSWLDQGAPPAFVLAELGPGRGTLMADLLRATRSVPGFHAALKLHLVEASPTLRAAQAALLADAEPVFHDSPQDLPPDKPIWLVANEFFDALPIRQFQRQKDGWRERLVGFSEGELGFGLGAVTAPPSLAHRMDDTRVGDIVEICPGATTIAVEIGERIKAHGGAAILIDYGDWHGLGDTFQAIRKHAPVDPFAEPGNADLTAHVDFEAIARAAPCAHSQLTPQGTFLDRLGIAARIEILLRRATPAQSESLRAAFRRLTDPGEMGSVFKVMSLHPTDAPPPAGLMQ